MAVLSTLDYATSTVAMAAIVRRLRSPSGYLAGRHYITVAMMCWTVALMMWTPAARHLLSEFSDHHLAWEIGSVVQMLAAGLIALLANYVGARRGRRTELVTGLLLVAMVLIRCVSYLSPPMSAIRFTGDGTWSVAVAVGYMWYLHQIAKFRKREIDPLVKLGLDLSKAAALLGIALAVCSFATNVLLFRHEGRFVYMATAVTVCATGVTLAGVLAGALPSLVPTVVSIWGRARAKWSYKRLLWLWKIVTEEVPDVVLRSRADTAHEQLCRSIVEIRDAQRNLGAYVHPSLRRQADLVAAQHQYSRRRADVLWEAAQLGIGIDRRRRGMSQHHIPWPWYAPDPETMGNMLAEARYLLQVGRALRHNRLVLSLRLAVARQVSHGTAGSVINEN
jgi:hypothetical protein